MLGKKGKIFVLAGMVALLVATGVLNIVLNQNTKDAKVGSAVTAQDYFADFRLDRETTRADSILLCEAIISDPDASAEAKVEAEDLRKFYVAAKETERVLEELIKAVGFDEAVVTTTTENVNVILKTPELTSEQVGRVVEIVIAETGKVHDNIRVIPVS